MSLLLTQTESSGLRNVCSIYKYMLPFMVSWSIYVPGNRWVVSIYHTESLFIDWISSRLFKMILASLLPSFNNCIYLQLLQHRILPRPTIKSYLKDLVVLPFNPKLDAVVAVLVKEFLHIMWFLSCINSVFSQNSKLCSNISYTIYTFSSIVSI